MKQSSIWSRTFSTTNFFGKNWKNIKSWCTLFQKHSNFFVFPNFVSIITMTWRIIGKKNNGGLICLFAPQKKYFFSVLEISHICGQGYGYGKKDLLWGLINSKKGNNCLKLWKKCYVDRYQRKKKKDSPSPKKWLLCLFLFGRKRWELYLNRLCHVFEANPNKNTIFSPMLRENLNFCCRNLTLLFLFGKNKCVLISTLPNKFYFPLKKVAVVWVDFNFHHFFWFKLSTTKYDILS